MTSTNWVIPKYPICWTLNPWSSDYQLSSIHIHWSPDVKLWSLLYCESIISCCWLKGQFTAGQFDTTKYQHKFTDPNIFNKKDQMFNRTLSKPSLRPCVIDSLFRVPWPPEIGARALLTQHKIELQHSALSITDLQKKFVLRILKILKNWWAMHFPVMPVVIISYHIITQRHNPIGFLPEVWSPLQATVHLRGIFYLPWHRRSGTRDHGF
jgi:hypothetical protein